MKFAKTSGKNGTRSAGQLYVFQHEQSVSSPFNTLYLERCHDKVCTYCIQYKKILLSLMLQAT
jgi:hypothetical protein